MADKFNLNGFSVDNNNYCYASNFIGTNSHSEYVVVCQYDPDKTAIENGRTLLERTTEIEQLAFEMSEKIDPPYSGIVNFDWFKPTLVIESGYYDLDGEVWTPGRLETGPGLPNEGLSSYFNITGPTRPYLGLDTDLDTGEYVPAVLTGIPQVWIKGDVNYEIGYRANCVGLLFDGDITCGASLQFDNCWFIGGVDAGEGTMGTSFTDCRFDSQVGVLNPCGSCFTRCYFSEGTTGSFSQSLGSTVGLRFVDCIMLGSDLFQMDSPNSEIRFDRCRINGDGVFQPVDPFNWSALAKVIVRDTEFFNTDANNWWDGYTVSGPTTNEFIRCEGLATNQQAQAARIVYCVDRTNTLMTHK